MKKEFDKFVNVYTQILYAFGCIFFLAFCVCVLIRIISRNLLSWSPAWTSEAARYTFIYMVAFGCGAAVLKDEFVCAGFLKDALEERGLYRAGRVVRLLITVVMLILSVFILLAAVPGFVFIRFRMVSMSMQLPMQIIYFSQFLIFAFISISLIIRIVWMVRAWNDDPGKGSGCRRESDEVNTGEVS